MNELELKRKMQKLIKALSEVGNTDNPDPEIIDEIMTYYPGKD